MTTEPQKVRETLESYIKAWTIKDKQLLLSLFAEDATLEDPVGTPPFTGHEGIGRFWDFALQDSKRQVTPRLEEIRALPGAGVVRFTMEVRLPETHEGLNLSIVEYAEFNEAGRIQRLRVFWDETSVSAPDGWALFAPNIEEAYTQ